MVSILLALAVASVCADGGAASSLELRAPTQRSNKSLKRDLEFYTKEMARIVQDNAAMHSALLSQALYVMGCVAMAHSNEYAVVFAALNELLLATSQRVRAQPSRQGDSDAAGSRATAKHETRLLQRTSLACLATATARLNGETELTGAVVPDALQAARSRRCTCCATSRAASWL